MDKTAKNRLVLGAIAVVFGAPLLIAFALNLSGWEPTKTRNYGALVQPPVDVSAVPVALAPSGELDWRDAQWHWTLLALANADCSDACRTRLAEIMRLRITMGRNAERLRVVYIGAPLPADVMAALAPMIAASDGESAALEPYRPKQPGAVALALVDPNGLLMLRYDAGYDAARLREDIVKVVH